MLALSLLPFPYAVCFPLFLPPPRTCLNELWACFSGTQLIELIQILQIRRTKALKLVLPPPPSTSHAVSVSIWKCLDHVVSSNEVRAGANSYAANGIWHYIEANTINGRNCWLPRCEAIFKSHSVNAAVTDCRARSPSLSLSLLTLAVSL